MTIFIAGVHGVGKSYLCQKYAVEYGVVHESASELIRKERALADWTNDKKVASIDDNQIALKSAVMRINEVENTLLLDGHFVLINSQSDFVALESNVFDGLGLTGVILIEAETNLIASRLAARDSEKSAVNLIKFIRMERDTARAVCTSLSVPLIILHEPSFKEFSDAVRNLVHQ